MRAPAQAGRSLLHMAAESGNESLAKALLAKGLNASEADAEGCTPLHCVSGDGAEAVVALLLASGTDADARAVNKVGRAAHRALAARR